MAALLEGKNNLLRMRQEIPLSDVELAALDDGVSALESLLSRLEDVPTPAGPTPLQLRDTALIQIEAAGLIVNAKNKKGPPTSSEGLRVEDIRAQLRWTPVLARERVRWALAHRGRACARHRRGRTTT